MKSAEHIASIPHNAFFNLSRVNDNGEIEVFNHIPTKSSLVGYSFPVYPDWSKLAGQQLSLKEEMFLNLLRAKLQIPAFAKALLDSGDALLIEDRPDKFWGNGRNEKGEPAPEARNALGELLMIVRQELREQISQTGTYKVPTCFSEVVCKYLGIEYIETPSLIFHAADLSELDSSLLEGPEFIITSTPAPAKEVVALLNEFGISIAHESVTDSSGKVLFSLPLGTHFTLSDTFSAAQVHQAHGQNPHHDNDDQEDEEEIAVNLNQQGDNIPNAVNELLGVLKDSALEE